MIRRGWFQLVWLLNIVLLLTGGTISQSEDARYAYFFDLDKYVKVELSTHRIVARGSLYEYEEIKSLLPTSIKSGGPPGLIRYDRNAHRLYFGAVDPETYSDVKHKERILIVQLPDFRLVGRIDLDRFVDRSFNTLLTPDGKRLFVSYEVSNLESDKESFVYVREVYDTESFKLLETKKAVVPRAQWTPAAGRPVYFSASARFSEDGQTIYDDDVGWLGVPQRPRLDITEEYVINGDHVTKRKKPDWPLPVREFMARNPDIPPIWATPLRDRVVLVDLKYDRVMGTMRDTKTGQVRPTGKTFLGEAVTTGEVVYYDARAGGRLKRFTVKEVAGYEPRVLCVTPDGRTAYLQKLIYRRRGENWQWEHYAIDLLSGKAIKLKLFNSAHVQCIFADR